MFALVIFFKELPVFVKMLLDGSDWLVVLQQYQKQHLQSGYGCDKATPRLQMKKIYFRLFACRYFQQQHAMRRNIFCMIHFFKSAEVFLPPQITQLHLAGKLQGFKIQVSI